VEEQVVVIYAVTTGRFDSVAVADVRRAETELREFFRARHNHILEGISSTGKLPEGDEMDNAITAFVESFVTEE
jgi:F-type H+-transporting ATPase subunit alpha